MPLYQHIIVALPKYSTEGLVKMMKQFSKIVISNGGVMRGIENNGVRPLAEKAKRKYATSEGERYFWDARYITATYDACPKTLIEAERFLKNEDGVIRSFNVKVKTSFDKVRQNTYRNRYSSIE